MTRNYQKELEKIITLNQTYQKVPTLVLHSCCAPCSSYVIEYLSQFFSITVFYYNPNIYPDEEYEKRVEEQRRFIVSFPTNHKVTFQKGNFEKQRFYDAVKGLEQEKEGGARCSACFRLRLAKTAELAKELNADYFSTTLTISPLKNAAVLNDLGEQLAQEYQIAFLPSDFKKKNGYKRSVEISKEYGMYRQDYCGCVFSKQEREQQKLQRL